MENIELGYKLREHRKIKKLTQIEVAELTNLNVKTIQRYEKGQNIPESFLHIFGEKLKLEAIDRNELTLLHLGALKNTHKEIKFHINEILKEIGYEISKILNFNPSNTNDNFIIKNNITNEYFLASNSPYNFDYANLIFNFLKSVIEEDLKNAKPISANELKLYLSNEYKNLMEYYNIQKWGYELSMLTPEFSKNSNKKSLDEIEKWKETELQKLKEKFLEKQKREE